MILIGTIRLLLSYWYESEYLGRGQWSHIMTSIGGSLSRVLVSQLPNFKISLAHSGAWRLTSVLLTRQQPDITAACSVIKPLPSSDSVLAVIDTSFSHRSLNVAAVSLQKHWTFTGIGYAFVNFIGRILVIVSVSQWL